jgi:hypothetical protein
MNQNIIFQLADTNMNIINNNPYRILGVFANSPKKDVVANKGKATALLKVNRPVEFPLDLQGLLSAPNRTIDLMNEAEAQLAIAKEQIKCAQFWFIREATLSDEKAFGNLFSGNIPGAIDIWSEEETISSLQNKLVCYLIDNKTELAVKTAELLYAKFGNSYVQKIDPTSTIQMSSEDLLHYFLDTLGDEIGMQNLLGLNLKPETVTYINNQTIGPLINKISSEVDRSKKVDHKDGNARLSSARKLVKNTREDFSSLKEILSENDPQLQMVADKLGSEILQCSIDYYNNSGDKDKHQTTLKMQKYASSIVMGSLAKQRCEDNIKTLQRIIDELPPLEVNADNECLKQKIAKFVIMQNCEPSDVLAFIKDVRAEIVSIKTKLGKSHAFYIAQSTLVAQVVLGKSIDALNEVQDEEFPQLSGYENKEPIKRLRQAFGDSWETMMILDVMDLSPEFRRERLKPNREALKKILNDIGAFSLPIYKSSPFSACARNTGVSPHMFYTDDEMFGECKNIDACKEYLSMFPHGAHIIEVKSTLAKLESEQEEFQTYKNARKLEDFENYISKYPNGKYIEECRKKYAELKKKKDEQDRLQEEDEKQKIAQKINNCKGIGACSSLLDSTRSESRKALRSLLDDKFYSLCKTKKDYLSYMEKFGHGGNHYNEAKAKSQENVVLLWAESHKSTLITLLVIIVFFFVIGSIWGAHGIGVVFGILALICGILGFYAGEIGCFLWILAAIFGFIASSLTSS